MKKLLVGIVLVSFLAGCGKAGQPFVPSPSTPGPNVGPHLYVSVRTASAQGRIDVYTLPITSNAQHPVHSIASVGNPAGISFDSGLGRMYVADPNPSNPTVEIYAAPLIATQPSSFISTPQFFPTDTAVDSAGALYVSSAAGTSILVFNQPLSGNPASYQISNGVTDPTGLGFDHAGNLFEVNGSIPEVVNEFVPPLSATSAPYRTFGSGSGGGKPVVDPYSGDLYVPDQTSIDVYGTTFTRIDQIHLPGNGVAVGVVFDQAGNMVVVGWDGTIMRDAIFVYPQPHRSGTSPTFEVPMVSGATLSAVAVFPVTTPGPLPSPSPLPSSSPSPSPTPTGSPSPAAQRFYISVGNGVDIYDLPLGGIVTARLQFPGNDAALGLSFDGAGTLYAADFTANSVYIYNQPIIDGSLPAGTISGLPADTTATAFDSSVSALYVANGSRVSVFTPPIRGGSVPAFNITNGITPPFPNAMNVAAAGGNLIVSQANNLLLFTPPLSGNSTATSFGRTDGQNETYVAVDPVSSEVYATYSSEVDTYRGTSLDFRLMLPSGVAGPITFDASDHLYVVAFSSNGPVVYVYQCPCNSSSTPTTFSLPLEDGSYTAAAVGP